MNTGIDLQLDEHGVVDKTEVVRSMVRNFLSEHGDWDRLIIYLWGNGEYKEDGFYFYSGTIRGYDRPFTGNCNWSEVDRELLSAPNEFDGDLLVVMDCRDITSKIGGTRTGRKEFLAPPLGSNNAPPLAFTRAFCEAFLEFTERGNPFTTTGLHYCLLRCFDIQGHGQPLHAYQGDETSPIEFRPRPQTTNTSSKSLDCVMLVSVRTDVKPSQNEWDAWISANLPFDVGVQLVAASKGPFGAIVLLRIPVQLWQFLPSHEAITTLGEVY